LTRVEARRPDLRFPLPEDFARRLTGRKIVALDRRAKYLTAKLDDGHMLLMHLGMSGRFSIAGGSGPVGKFVHTAVAAGQAEGKHDHVVFETGSGARIVYTDHRRFGMMDVFDPAKGHRLLDGLGPEPLDPLFSGPALLAAVKGKRTPAKSALLDQTIVAGLGNIYVCEALHRARVAPGRLAGTLGLARCTRLVSSIRDVLSEAIDAGGSTLRDYRQAGGDLGYFQHAFRVYGREGAACPAPKCRGTIGRTVQSGRSTFACPVCQR
jgi:formamidopyrimidine-DNA glycosylase